MAFFGRNKNSAGDVSAPTPFIAEVLRRIGEEYGGFDAMAPLPAGAGGPGMELAVHILGIQTRGTSETLNGTGIVRTVRVFAGHTEVYDDDQLIARFDDLTTADVFGERNFR